MKFKLLHRTISYILILCLLISLYGCGNRNGNSEIINPELLSSRLDNNGISDTTEKDIRNNDGKILFSSPQKDKLTVHDEFFSFSGLCNVDFPLLLDGKEQSVGEDGYFTFPVKLELGRNVIVFQNGKFKKVFSITYTKPLIKSYTPSDSSLTLDGGMPLSVTAVVKSGAKVSAEYNGKTFSLETTGEGDGVYETYKCVLTTAKNGSHTIKITASLDGDTQTVKASKIVIGGKSNLNYNPSPVKSMQNKGYVDVGETYIAEVVASTAEGFLGGTVDDYSRPTVNYLPRGTMDYCSTSKIYDSESGKKYYLLRNNIRVYAKKKNVKLYKGKLPETNSVSYGGGEIRDKHLLLNFKVDWRAPFRFVLGGQGYSNEGAQNYNISSQNFSYVDVTFCYSDALCDFTLPENPIFGSYEIIKNSKDYTLRLHLKTKGNFWGWKATYTSSNTLQFSFLCPSKIEKADNKYGYSLKGIKITIDAGHGGSDSGTYNAANSSYHEKYYTLIYAKTLANELLRLGATVYMPRTEDKTVPLEKRYNYITATNADLAVSVHFNGSSNGEAGGYFMGYFNPYTYNVAKSISKSVASTGLISTDKGGLSWHYFNLSRVSACPVVLTENGYLTGINDYKKIKTSTFCKGYIEGLVRGIVNYFAEGSGYAANYNSYTSTPSRVVVTSSAGKTSRPNLNVSIPSRVVVPTPSSHSSSSKPTTSNKRPITIVSSVPSRVVTSSVPSKSEASVSSIPSSSQSKDSSLNEGSTVSQSNESKQTNTSTENSNTAAQPSGTS